MHRKTCATVLGKLRTRIPGGMNQLEALSICDGVKLNQRLFGAEFHEDEELPVGFRAQMADEIGLGLPDALEPEGIGIGEVLIQVTGNAAGLHLRRAQQKAQSSLELAAAASASYKAKSLNDHFGSSKLIKRMFPFFDTPGRDSAANRGDAG
jgi:hypothetical protein